MSLATITPFRGRHDGASDGADLHPRRIRRVVGDGPLVVADPIGFPFEAFPDRFYDRPVGLDLSVITERDLDLLAASGWREVWTVFDRVAASDEHFAVLAAAWGFGDECRADRTDLTRPWGPPPGAVWQTPLRWADGPEGMLKARFRAMARAVRPAFTGSERPPAIVGPGAGAWRPVVGAEGDPAVGTLLVESLVELTAADRRDRIAGAWESADPEGTVVIATDLWDGGRGLAMSDLAREITAIGVPADAIAVQSVLLPGDDIRLSAVLRLEGVR